jgi:heavy metal sensor kinase
MLGVLCTGVYVALRQNFYEKAGGILKIVCRSNIAVLQTELLRGETDRQAASRTLDILHLEPYSVAIFNQDGLLLAETAGGPKLALGSRPLAPDGTMRLLTIRGAQGDGELRRMVVVGVQLNPPGHHYTIVVSQSLGPLLGALDADRRVLLLVVPLGLLLAGLGGWFLVKKSLAPVLAMSEQAHRIGIESLHQRLPVGNARDELGHLANTFNQLLDRLGEAFSLQRQFMADASHELRNPVSIIRTASSVTLERDHREESEYRGALAIIDDEVAHLTRVVDDMFHLARADAGRMSPRRSTFYLDEMLQDITRAAALLGTDKHITVAIEPTDELVCDGDEKLLRQLFSNLLENAVRYTPPGGRVTVQVQEERGVCEIAVADTGRGIPEEFRSRIFERFFRVETVEPAMIGHQSASATGAGLGLAIARSIATAHHGSLVLQRSNPGGSVFVVTLPLGRIH